ncbi:hypothetical protein B5P42_12080 [Bacillus sp. SRB_331]|nr:hypothetical protein B5P42_12080 [Bacillus sp. SRB_331]
MDVFTSIFTKKFMIWLISRVCHYLTITLRSPADNRGFFYLNKDFVLILLNIIRFRFNKRVRINFNTYHIHFTIKSYDSTRETF